MVAYMGACVQTVQRHTRNDLPEVVFKPPPGKTLLAIPDIEDILYACGLYEPPHKARAFAGGKCNVPTGVLLRPAFGGAIAIYAKSGKINLGANESAARQVRAILKDHLALDPGAASHNYLSRSAEVMARAKPHDKDNKQVGKSFHYMPEHGGLSSYNAVMQRSHGRVK